MTAGTAEQALDNPVWHALRGPLSRFAAPEATADLVHFDREVGLFSAVDRLRPDAWRRIAAMTQPEGFCCLLRDVIPAAPEGWQEHVRSPLWQMVAGELPAPSNADVAVLGPADHAEMQALVHLTGAAPFFARTPELGRYLGVRREGQLLAMAGERLRLSGYVEISAVCTHPNARGQGLATELTLHAAQFIREGGDEAMLHVEKTNEGAFRLYQKLGFVVRGTLQVVFAQRDGRDQRPGD